MLQTLIFNTSKNLFNSFIINTVKIQPFIYTCKKNSNYFMCFITCFISLSLTLLISFNITKIVYILNVCNHFTNYFS